MPDHWLVRLRGIFLLVGLFPGMTRAGELQDAAVTSGVQPSGETITSVDQLKCLDACELEHLFGTAEAGTIPVGLGRGRILVLTDTHWPRLKARLAGSVWKGKYFEEDGHVINQWLGFRALQSQAEFGPSWYDGRVCIVMEYAPGTPVFGNARDEIREIRPGLYLGRVYDRCPCPKLRGFFALEISPNECPCH